MKLIHRVSLSPTEKQLNCLLALGLNLEQSKSSVVRLVTFEIDETSEHWGQVADIIRESRAVDIPRTEFSPLELQSAKHFNLLATQKGYPQPSRDFGYLQATYNLESYCDKCGTGKRQAAPFRMSGEPKWGRCGIMSLNWIPDAIFVKPDVWDDVFRDEGIDCAEVLDHRTSEPLSDVVQLEIPKVNEPFLVRDGHSVFTCFSCGRQKFAPVTRGFFPAITEEVRSSLVTSCEWFGSGGMAWNAVIVSNSVWTKLNSLDVRGPIWTPVECYRPN